MRIYIIALILFIISIIVVSILSYKYYNNYNIFKELYSDQYYEYNKYIKKYIKTGVIADNIKNPLFQTYYNKSKIPSDVYNNIKKYAPEYTHIIMDDKEIIEFLKKHYNERVLNAFNSLKVGAHKADLARYCLIYIYGGLYMDIKSELVMSLKDVFNKGDIFYTVDSIIQGTIYQGIIKSPKNNPLFLSLIDYIVETGNPKMYHDFCRDLYVKIEKDTGGSIKSGLNKGKNNRKYYIFKEKCSITDSSMCYDGFDHTGRCCFVWDGDVPVIKTRRSSYPWK